MRCSECSADVLPVVAIDIDGTLADYHGHFLQFLSLWTDHPLELGYNGSERFRDWVCPAYGISLDAFRAAKLAYRQGGMKRTMPMYPGAADLVRAAREEGAEVWLTTTRPWDRYDRVDPDTREWLRRQGIEFDGLLYSDDKLHDLAESVDPGRVVAVLDDQYEQCEIAARIWGGQVPILARNSFNGGVEPIAFRHVETLPAARCVINQRIAQWKFDNE